MMLENTTAGGTVESTNEIHPIARAKERYDVEYSLEDLREIIRLCTEGKSKIVSDCCSVGSNEYSIIHHLRYKGKLIAPVLLYKYDNICVIATFMDTGKGTVPKGSYTHLTKSQRKSLAIVQQ
jgi:hypothetical protein